MPHLDSARKSLRQSASRNASNRAVVKELKTQIKKVLKSLKTGDKAAATTEYQLACSKLDKAGTRGYIHKNAASRTKGRLAARMARPAAPAKST